jgi:hypothetical protein
MVLGEPPMGLLAAIMICEGLIEISIGIQKVDKRRDDGILFGQRQT